MDTTIWIGKLKTCYDIQQVMQMNQDVKISKMTALTDEFIREIQSYLQRLHRVKLFHMSRKDVVPTPIAFPMKDTEFLDSFLSLTWFAVEFSQCDITNEKEFKHALSEFLTEGVTTSNTANAQGSEIEKIKKKSRVLLLFFVMKNEE